MDHALLPLALTFLAVARAALLVWLVVALAGTVLLHAALTYERFTDRWTYWSSDDLCFEQTGLTLRAVGTLAAFCWPWLLWVAVRGVSTPATPLPSPYGASDADDRSPTP